MARAVLPTCWLPGAGRIINLSSGGSTQALEGWSAYCAAKPGSPCSHGRSRSNTARPASVLRLFAGRRRHRNAAEIRASGINPVSRLPREQLASPSVPAHAIALLCTPAADPFSAGEVDVRDPAFRATVGLPAIAS